MDVCVQAGHKSGMSKDWNSGTIKISPQSCGCLTLKS